MICLFCGNEIKQQVPIIIKHLEMAVPWNEAGEVGNDVLSLKYACQPCYSKILFNAAKASGEMSEILIKIKR
jgi:hypothetical protein